MKEKIDLASQMVDSKLFSTDYIYDTLFDMSEDTYNEMRDLVREDHKRIFRLLQIENEGNDPAESGRSYGTPHDLASMYGRRTDPGSRVPLGYNEKDVGGRPRERMSMYGTQEDPLGGRDRLGTHGMKGGYPSDNENVNEATKAEIVYLQNKEIFDSKKLIFENGKQEEVAKMLDESNIKDLED